MAVAIPKLLLRRGQILLIAGGIVVVTSFAILGYYSMKFVSSLQNESRHEIAPGSHFELQRYISSAYSHQGAYIVALSEGNYQDVRIRVIDPANQSIVDKPAASPFVIETFSAPQDGNYTLSVTNLSRNSTVVTSAVLGDQESIVGSQTQVYSYALIAGIAIAVAGAAITIIDRKRLKEMKKFGDTSDLV